MNKQRGMQILGLLLLFSFIFTLLQVQPVAAQGFVEGLRDIFGLPNSPVDPIVDLFTFQESLSVSTNVTKYLFILLITLFIWSVLESSGFIQSNLVRWLISFIVSFLAVSFFTTETLNLVLLNYEALGLTLLFLFPILILMLFTWRVIAHFRNPGAVLFQWLAWGIYGLFLIYRLIADWSQLGNGAARGIFIAAIALTFFMFIGNKWARQILGKEYTQSEIESAVATEERAAALTKARADALRREAS